MSEWQTRKVPFKFQLSDWTLFSVALPMQVRKVPLLEADRSAHTLKLPADLPPAGCEGFVVRSLPVSAGVPPLSYQGAYACYLYSQYFHYYIDLSGSFEQYKAKFSSKTRSTLNRKVAKFSQHCGGELNWKGYTSPEEMRPFFSMARVVSAKTYQERLLEAGLPDSEAFVSRAERLAGEDRIRAYILFDNDRPVSYLYCPVEDGVLIYAYLGYDPEYLKLSVGTVLQWLALERLFDEKRFQFFDFTEGQSEHKRLFATHGVQAADVFFVHSTWLNMLLVRSHLAFTRISSALGKWLQRAGWKVRIKRWLRFGAQARA